MNKFSVRVLREEDIKHICDYWNNASPEFLNAMGVEMSKLPSAEKLETYLKKQLMLPLKQRESYATIWLVDDTAIGHCNVSPFKFGDTAMMHLHIWNLKNRRQGVGQRLVMESLHLFFENLALQEIICEPYAMNLAPNKTIEKVGFDLVKEYKTIPGVLNFEQRVKRWRLTKEKFKRIKNSHGIQ